MENREEIIRGVDMNKLGMKYSPKETMFRVWAPEREKVELLLYENSNDNNSKAFKMEKTLEGVHELIVKGDLKGKFYTYLVEGKDEVTDPYSIASSMNSEKSAIIDLKDTNPKGWEDHTIPEKRSITQEIIYEVHIKDFTIHKSSGVNHRGKYLGFCEENSKYNGLTTGIDHLKELGITCVHLLPVYDYLTVNEDIDEFYKDDNYNWGYDPELYNVPEGSYSIDSKDPSLRILELKTMIMNLHQAGIKVILDVVYNHTYKSYDSNFNILNPGYYYRMNPDGSFSNGSGCGNEVATEKPMVRKFILDSLKYWLEEYKVDGFRFDLMALMDIYTMKEITEELREIKEDIIIYGEPWAGGSTVLPEEIMTTKKMHSQLGIAVFNDEFRDAIKGDNDGYSKGYSQGNDSYIETVKNGILGKMFNSPKASINYVNCHDNLILYDKMKKVFPESSEEEIQEFNKFALSILLLSQGIPFIHSGNEFLRSKSMVENSYKSPVSINGIDWSLKEKNYEFYSYIRDLIKIRKSYEEFSISLSKEIDDKIKYLDIKSNLIAYTISRAEKVEFLLIIHNGNMEEVNILTDDILEILKEIFITDKNHIKITEVFNYGGILKENNVVDKLTIKRLSTSIYEIQLV